MAGTLTLDTLKAGSGVLATQNGMTGIAKAWVNYNGSAQTITGSFNVSSVTYVGTGRYTVNFTTAMPNTTYASALSAKNLSGSNVNGVVAEIGSSYGTAVRTTSALGIVVMDSNNGAVNSDVVSVIIFSS